MKPTTPKTVLDSEHNNVRALVLYIYYALIYVL